MNCPVCGNKMRNTQGKFGEFFSCRGHGTLSVQNGVVVSKGEITKALRKLQAQAQVGETETAKPYPAFDLELEVRKRAVYFGGWISELDQFIEGGPGIADTEPDHWMNLRPY